MSEVLWNFQHFNVCEYVFRILSLKTKDTSASSWLFDFVSYFLARYKNENKQLHVSASTGQLQIVLTLQRGGI